LINQLENTDTAKVRLFQLRDNKGHGMDCLEVFQVRERQKSGYYGVSHSLHDGAFSVHLTYSYENAQVDQLAKGTLTNFENWKTSPSPIINTALKKLGGNGNLGDRSKFAWHNQTYYLQEVQSTRSDWSTWGIFLCDDDGFP